MVLEVRCCVAVFVGATNAYADLKQSLDRTYAEQLLPDVVISGPGVAGIQQAAQELPGTPVVQLRQQADAFIRVNGRTLFGRAVGVPVAIMSPGFRVAKVER